MSVRAAAIVLLALFALVACRDRADRNVGREQIVLVRKHGIELRVPASWHVRAERPAGYAPFLLAATFPLPEEDNGRGARAKQRMEPGDVLINVADYETSGRRERLPEPAIRPGDVRSPFEGQTPQTAAQATRTSGRIQIWVTFGSDPDAATLRGVNDILATLRVG